MSVLITAISMEEYTHQTFIDSGYLHRNVGGGVLEIYYVTSSLYDYGVRVTYYDTTTTGQIPHAVCLQTSDHALWCCRFSEALYSYATDPLV
jgi:hypothetical protein